MFSYLKRIKSISLFDILITMRIGCGFYCNCIPNKLLAGVCRVMCVLTPVLVCYLAIFKSVNSFALNYIICSAFKVLVTVFASAITGDEYVLKYKKFLNVYDKTMGQENIPRENLVVGALFVMIMACRLLTVVMYLYSFPFLYNDIPTFHCVDYLVLGADLCFMLESYVTHSLWVRLQLLTVWVNDHVKNSNDRVQSKIFAYRKCLIAYKHLLDNVATTDKTRKLIALLILPSNAASLVLILTNGFHLNTDKDVVQGQDYRIFAVKWFLDLVLHFIGIFSPAFFLEMVAFEYEKLIKFFAYELIDCSDEEARSMLLEALDYLATRPAKFSLYRLLPLDASLVTTVSGFTASSTIVYLQTSQP